ncbi:response regulator [Anditalea andensis]|uniref:LuxR family transcriptional regulator n=1 Tax=Anditalea andensis TaxID=1048983 RepID=A0A074KYR1_9BACT|nr:response regulator transcription factor [Anditalea andensis]KEO73375.1 LuxR family transcriptional regulator [Anditalea andensis]
MIKIVMVDDHKMFASGIAHLLEIETNFHIAGIFQNGEDVLSFVQSNDPDILLTDLNMPGMDGLDLIEQITLVCPKCKVIVLTMYEEKQIYKKCQKAGAKAYVLKDADPDELVYTIKEVFENRHVMNFHNTLKQVTDDFYTDVYKEKYKLSRRELQILKMIKNGEGNKKIAENLNLSIFTVETHRKNIHLKLDVNSGVELLKKAMDMNL